MGWYISYICIDRFVVYIALNIFSGNKMWYIVTTIMLTVTWITNEHNRNVFHNSYKKLIMKITIYVFQISIHFCAEMQKTATLPTTTQKCLSVRSSMYLINTCSYTRNTMLLLVLLSLFSMTNPHTFERILWQKQKNARKNRVPMTVTTSDRDDEIQKKHVYLLRQLSLRFIILLREAIDRRRERGREYKPVNLNVLLRESSIGVAINTKFAGESVMTLSTVHQHHTHTTTQSRMCVFYLTDTEFFKRNFHLCFFIRLAGWRRIYAHCCRRLCADEWKYRCIFYIFMCCRRSYIYMCVRGSEKKEYKVREEQVVTTTLPLCT